MRTKQWLCVALIFGCAACGKGIFGERRNSPAAPQSAKDSVGISPDGKSSYAPPTFTKLTHDPSKARHLALIQKSELGLSAEERAVLTEKGFVITPRQKFVTFAHGYAQIYKNDLPVYVSADSLLEPVHRSYSLILKYYEKAVVIPEFGKLLDNLRTRLSEGVAKNFGAQAERDVDLYLAVASSLLATSAPKPVRGAELSEVEKLVSSARTASGVRATELFGRRQDIEFSQFTPRGHYAGDAELERYFRAQMWFGRVDMRVVDVDDDGKSELSRRALNAMLALRALLDDVNLQRFRDIDRALATFVGERDNMSFTELDSMLADMKLRTLDDARRAPDEKWVQAFTRGNYGSQRIASHVRYNSEGRETHALSRSFSPLGQRFVIDSEVLSNVVYDRLIVKQRPPRLMPAAMDVAYAALGNAQAKTLLASEIKTYGYETALDQARAQVDAKPPEFWRSNMYNAWLHALRALSPGQTDPQNLPSVARTETWGLRILNTQLASWAELRHDTILYAKQSYAAGILCEFPDAYVDPYPEFFQRLEELAQAGQELGKIAARAGQQSFAEGITRYFTHLGSISSMLKDMAARELRREPWKPEHLAFINQAVRITQPPSVGCGPGEPVLSGWYRDLFFVPDEALTFEPTIADVHTQPTDAAGNQVGRVLHVATGLPRLMVVTVDTCNGPSAYAGLVFTYHEEITQGFARLTDEEWEPVVHTKRSPEWLNPALPASK